MEFLEILSYLFSAVVVGVAGYYAFSNKDKLDHMCCMMVGMIYSTLAGFAFGSFYALFTGQYLMANVVGIVVGLVSVLLLNIHSKIGDEFARMEGVMGAVMGGLMGAMFGFMIRFEDKFSVVIFLYAVILLLAFEASWFIYKHAKKKNAVDCCTDVVPNEAVKENERINVVASSDEVKTV